MRQYCKKLVSIVFIYLVLSLSMAMSVFSAAEAPTIDVKFEDKIYHSTGDMTLTLPLLNVPGRGDSSFPINLYYTGGGGIPIESEASWVGLGWSLDIGSINRFVKGLPDDTLKITDSNYPDNVYMIWKQVVKDETPWYKKLVNVVPWIILFIIACVTSPDKATPFVFKIAHWLMFKAIAYEMSGSRGTFFSLTDAIDLVGFTKGTKVDLMKSKTIVELINIYGYAGTAYSAFSMVGYVVGASPTTVNTKPAPHKQNGYLYDPFYEEIVRDDKPLLSDGGSPDIYAISGPGVGGSMILGSSATTGRHTTSADAEFFMANIPSRNAVDIDFYNQIDHCEDYDPAVSSSRPIQGLTYENAEERLQLNKELGLCKTMSGDIDMFVVTLTDGSRLVYGDPSVKASTERIYRSGDVMWTQFDKSFQPSGSFVDYDMDIKLMMVRNIIQQYPSSWKLTAVLGPAYIDGSPVPDFNPLNSESSNKGDWVAFTYDWDIPGNSAREWGYYNYGSTRTGAAERNIEGWHTYTGGIKTMSYLKSVETSLYKATFDVSRRKDAKEVSPSKFPMIQPSNVADYLTKKSVIDLPEWYSNTFIPKILPGIIIPQSAAKDNPVKLDKISLINKKTNTVEKIIKFNSGISSDESYSLMPDSPGSENNLYKGKYTLRRVDSCDSSGSDCYMLADFYYDAEHKGACSDQPRSKVVMNRVELHITGEGEKRLKSYPLKDLGWDCEHPELKFNLQADSSERGGWDFGVFTWITITDPQGNTIHKSGAKTTSGKGRRSSLVSFKFNPGKYSLSELTLNVYGYKCGTSKDVDHHFRTCWGKAKASDNIRLEYLGVETVNSLGWSNPSYDKDQHDTWGLFWTQGGPLDHNGPNAFGSKFSPEGFGLADAWVLKTLRVASGANISWEYEVDDWFTSRGDVFQPLYGKYLNYYAYMRNKAQPDDTLCQNNYGGGLKVTSETKCDGVSSCIKTNYDYSVYDPSLKCFRSAGAIDTVPYAPPSTYNDYDIRRPGHMGSEYGVGSVFYNQVKVMPDDQDTYQAFKYFTVDSTPESTDGATDVNMMDDFGGNTPHDFDELGSSANTPQPWKRGQEYWIGYYSTNPALGRNGLLREVKRSFTSHEHIKYFFQDVKLIAVHPLKIVQEEIDFPDAEYDGKRYGKFYGASSGTMRVSNTSMILYDPGAGEQFQIDNFFEYDPYSGQPNKITLVSDDITKVMTIKYAFETNPILLARHILSPVYETTSYEDEEAPGNALISKQIIYKNFAD